MRVPFCLYLPSLETLEADLESTILASILSSSQHADHAFLLVGFSRPIACCPNALYKERLLNGPLTVGVQNPLVGSAALLSFKMATYMFYCGAIGLENRPSRVRWPEEGDYNTPSETDYRIRAQWTEPKRKACRSHNPRGPLLECFISCKTRSKKPDRPRCSLVVAVCQVWICLSSKNSLMFRDPGRFQPSDSWRQRTR